MNLVFDFGKVVFDWEPRALVARLLPQHAADDAAAAALEAGVFQGFGGDWAEFDRGTLDVSPLAELIARRTGITAADACRIINAVPDALRVLPAMAALIARLHKGGTPLYFLSNMPRPFADALEAAHPFLRPSPDGWFRDGVYSGRVGCVKPEPAIYALAVRRFGVAPGDTLLVDDLQVNVEAARAAGWQGMRFESAAQCERDLRALGLG